MVSLKSKWNILTPGKIESNHCACVSYVGQGVLDVPLHQVADLVKDIESSFLWEKYLVVRCIFSLKTLHFSFDVLANIILSVLLGLFSSTAGG